MADQVNDPVQAPSDDQFENTQPKDIADHYSRLLIGRESNAATVESTPQASEFDGLETVPTVSALDLSRPAIDDRLDETREALHRIVEEYLQGDPELYKVTDEIVDRGGDALDFLRSGNDEQLRQRKVQNDLEGIVRTDGSRPSFMIRNDEVDLASSPVGGWNDIIAGSIDKLRDFARCVGRIDVPGAPQGFTGTGFLVHENLIITNRHVLQASADPIDNNEWEFKQGAVIDFGHEFRGRETLNRRALKNVVFCAPDAILDNLPIDHNKLDLALIELEPTDDALLPSKLFSLDIATDWANSDLDVYIVGYPGQPKLGGVNQPTLLELLFQSTYGYKRLAPGKIMTSTQMVTDWTATHDATTLGGNSGSVVLVVGREYAAAALHYGGRNAAPLENWGHVIGKTLDKQDAKGIPLRQYLTDLKVTFANRTVGGVQV